jgi:transcriptional regulator with XRE-family HTH domain
MAVTPDTVHGHLVLLHGAPGTGKTTVLRTLAREWRTWCQADCVLDPEILFSEPGYLMDVAIGHDIDERAPQWRLLLLEDCDELIRGDAGQPASQLLSRLLNLTDGMLGQGRQVLVAITSNEDLRRLHPAVVRPGRCLAHIEIGLLSPAEAGALLGRPADAPVTLAELYAMRARRGAGISQAEPAFRAGVVPSVVSAYEAGRRQPSLPTLARLIDAAGADLVVDIQQQQPPQLSRLSGPVGRQVRRKRRDLVAVAAAHEVTNLRVFGSVARGEDRPRQRRRPARGPAAAHGPARPGACPGRPGGHPRRQGRPGISQRSQARRPRPRQP